MKIFNDGELIRKWDAIIALLSVDEYNQRSVQAIRNLSIIESERMRGKWQEHKDYPGLAYLCSECGYFTTIQTNFCPNCGADMRGV